MRHYSKMYYIPILNDIWFIFDCGHFAVVQNGGGNFRSIRRANSPFTVDDFETVIGRWTIGDDVEGVSVL